MKFWNKPISVALIVIVLAVSMSCRSSKNGDGMIEFDKNPPFRVTERYIQPWVAGIKEGGSGRNVTLRFSYSKNSEVTFLKMYTDNRVVDIPEYGKNPDVITVTINDANVRPNTVMSDDPVEEAVNTPSDRLKFNLGKDEVVINYMAEDEVRFFKVDSILVKDLLAYPGTKPNDEQKP